MSEKPSRDVRGCGRHQWGSPTPGAPRVSANSLVHKPLGHRGQIGAQISNVTDELCDSTGVPGAP